MRGTVYIVIQCDSITKLIIIIIYINILLHTCVRVPGLLHIENKVLLCFLLTLYSKLGNIS